MYFKNKKNAKVSNITYVHNKKKTIIPLRKKIKCDIICILNEKNH